MTQGWMALPEVLREGVSFFTVPPCMHFYCDVLPQYNPEKKVYCGLKPRFRMNLEFYFICSKDKPPMQMSKSGLSPEGSPYLY